MWETSNLLNGMEKSDSYLMWKINYMAHMVMLGLDDALNPDFEEELPTKEKDTFD
jgi:hypothetical protein